MAVPVDPKEPREPGAASTAPGPRKRLRRPLKAPATTSPLLTADDLAELLGTSRKAVYAMHARGELPGAIYLGPRRLRFDANEIHSWLSKKRAASRTGESR